jgi:hypothetical protein
VARWRSRLGRTVGPSDREGGTKHSKQQDGRPPQTCASPGRVSSPQIAVTAHAACPHDGKPGIRLARSGAVRTRKVWAEFQAPQAPERRFPRTPARREVHESGAIVQVASPVAVRLAGHAGLGRQAGLCTPGGQTPEFPAQYGLLRVGWHFCRRRDPQAGAVERLQGDLETNVEPGRQFVNERDDQAQLDAWFVKANARTHRTLRCRAVDRLIAEREAIQRLPAFPDLDRRWVTRVPADPLPALRYLRLLA